MEKCIHKFTYIEKNDKTLENSLKYGFYLKKKTGGAFGTPLKDSFS